MVILNKLVVVISRRDGENNGFLAGVPLLPPPSRVVSRPNSLPFPFERLPRRLFHSLSLKRDRAYSKEVLVLNLLSLKSLATT